MSKLRNALSSKPHVTPSAAATTLPSTSSAFLPYDLPRPSAISLLPYVLPKTFGVPIPFFALPCTTREQPPPRPRIPPIQAASTSQTRARSFAVGRVAHFLKTGRYAQRVGSNVPVHVFGVLEYLAAEVLELARNAARRTGSLRLRNDQELSKLLGSGCPTRAGFSALCVPVDSKPGPVDRYTQAEGPGFWPGVPVDRQTFVCRQGL
ncbi:hypothetical protein Taro_025337 [Colocasia esculenta]|uniref:Histone H2A n=1 Tax=Colocasia esculenta TaxID=4460 RepID=A0A843V9V7_COLES|nr:hypothetical protein [Colocasia esculenta]